MRDSTPPVATVEQRMFVYARTANLEIVVHMIICLRAAREIIVPCANVLSNYLKGKCPAKDK